MDFNKALSHNNGFEGIKSITLINSTTIFIDKYDSCKFEDDIIKVTEKEIITGSETEHWYSPEAVVGVQFK